jgi:DNA-binding MarR family transcriptional regulator
MTPDGRTLRDIHLSTYDIIAALMHNGLTLSQLAIELGMTRQRIHQIDRRCRQAGIYTRRRIIR